MRISQQWIACICGAAGLWLGFPNDLYSFPPAVLIWPLSLAYIGLNSSSIRNAFIYGWICGIIGSTAALYWLSFPLHMVGSLPWILAIFCAILITALLSIQGAIFSACTFIMRSLVYWRFSILCFLLWYLLEYIFAIAIGFPWLPLAGAFAPWTLMIQCSDIFGAYFTGALWFLTGLLVLAWPFKGFKIANIAVSFCGLCLAFGMLFYSYFQLRDNPLEINPQGKNCVSALFIEGNIEQNQKWVPEFQLSSLETYINLTHKGLQKARSEGIESPLIIWPETALPFFFEKNQYFSVLTKKCAMDADCPLLFGAPGIGRDDDLPDDAVFNRAFLLGPTGKVLGYYDKVHLVPFGEYTPAWIKFDFLEALLQDVGVYYEGKSSKPLEYGPLALGMLICYEGIFPWLAQERTSSGANILVDISNDGWFGNSPAAWQHLYLTVLRCVEQNRWLLRGTNTGISAIADTRGRITMAGPQYQAGFLIGSARLEEGYSFYHQYGSWLPLAALLVFCILLPKSGRQ